MAFALGGFLLVRLFFDGVAASAAEPNYIIKNWQDDQGLPQNSVNTVIQTHEGYLWLGTYDGLVRFDGIRFTIYDSGNTRELKNSRVTCLFEDSRNRLWIGHETGDVTCYKAGKFYPLAAPKKRDGRGVLGFGEDEAGGIWMLDAAGDLFRLQDGASFPPPVEIGVAGSTISFAKDKAKNLWVLRSGELSEIENGQPIPVTVNEFGTNFVKAICPSSDGGLWIMTGQVIGKWNNGQWGTDLRACPTPERIVTSLFELASGKLAVGTAGAGLLFLGPGASVQQFTHTNGLSDDWVQSLCQDDEDNLWIGTGNGGLDMLQPSRVDKISPPDRWQQRAVLSVCSAQDGSLWIGTEGAGLYHYRNDGSWEHFGESEGLLNPFVWSIFEDTNGQLWAGTWGGGLFIYADGRFKSAPELKDFTSTVTALYQDRAGNIWVGSGVGLACLSGGQAKWFRNANGVPLTDIRTILEDTDGAIWFGMSGVGLGRLKNGKLNLFHTSDGLGSDFVQCLHTDTNGVLWIGTFGGGLSRYWQGHFATVSTSQDIPNNVIVAIEDDGMGNFWISSHGGLFRVSKEELNRCADGKIQTVNCLLYGESKGLPTLECSGGFQPVVGRTHDGHLWFPTRKGLVGIAPDSVSKNILPPPVILEDVVVDSVSTEIPTNGLLKIQPGHGRLQLDYTAFCFTAPKKIRFRHKLDGWESDWVETETRSINYNLLPGNYTFHVTACNDDGVWNPTGASLKLTVLPLFWQTLTFRILIGVFMTVSAAGLVLFVMRRRMKLKLEHLERQRVIERERARIAQDIHDDLGANLTRIMLLSQSGQSPPSPLGSGTTNHEQIYETARDLTRAMDEIVWAVNPKHDTLDSLVTYLGKFAQSFLGAVSIRCRIEAPVQLPHVPLTAELRHNLFLAIKEALNNVAKHSQATEVRVSLVLDGNGFTLMVEDNGKGFVSAPGDNFPNEIRNGLLNMRNRLEKIHGSCEIESVPGSGTKITFHIQAKSLA